MSSTEAEWIHQDPGSDLLALLGVHATAAAPRIRALTLNLAEGAWDVERIPLGRRSSLGVLVLSGVVGRDLALAGSQAIELLGEGDVVNPWDEQSGDGFLPISTHWSVLTTARVLVLDPALVNAVARRRELLETVCAGAARRSARLAVHQAIAQLPRIDLRLLAVFWHLAGRWGRVGPEGVLLPLHLSHATLGRLVGARRPTVTLALGELAQRGYVHRREDGSWQLGAEAPAMLEGVTEPHRTRRRSPRRADVLDRTATELFAHVDKVRKRTAAQADAMPGHLDRLAEIRARSLEVREQSARLRGQLEARRTRSKRPPVS